MKLKKEQLKEINDRFIAFNEKLVKDFGVAIYPKVVPTWDLIEVPKEESPIITPKNLTKGM